MKMISETYVLFMREMRKWLSRKHVVLISLITPLFWILLFGKSFNISYFLAPDLPGEALKVLQERIIRLFGTQDYFTYMASGMLVIFPLFQSSFAGASLLFDKRLGYLNRLLVTPASRTAIFISRVLAATARILMFSSLLLAVTVLAGYKLKPGFGPLDLLGALAIVALISIALSSIFVMAALFVDSPEGLFALGNLLTAPLMFTSSALFPIDQMPWWLRTIAGINPVTYGADMIRYFLAGKELANPEITFAVILAGSMATFVITTVIATRALERG